MLSAAFEVEVLSGGGAEPPLPLATTAVAGRTAAAVDAAAAAAGAEVEEALCAGAALPFAALPLAAVADDAVPVVRGAGTVMVLEVAVAVVRALARVRFFMCLSNALKVLRSKPEPTTRM